MFNRSNNLTVS